VRKAAEILVVVVKQVKPKESPLTNSYEAIPNRAHLAVLGLVAKCNFNDHSCFLFSSLYLDQSTVSIHSSQSTSNDLLWAPQK